jgi:hypothetical protein
MAEGAVMHVARERDQALRRLQVLAAEIRAHEQTVRHNTVSPRRPAERALCVVCAKSMAVATTGRGGARRTAGPQPIAREGAGQPGRGPWA